MSHQNIPDTATQTDELQVVTIVDAKELRCPLPLLKAKQALNKVDTGQCVRVYATDKGSVRDFHAFARLSGHKLVLFKEYDTTYEYVLQKSDTR